MATPRPPSALNTRAPQGPSQSEPRREKTYFEQQREALIGEIALSFEQVLANINKLNRSLEAVVAVGNEFSSVEALWSQFEGVLGYQQAQQQQQAQQSQSQPQPQQQHSSSHEEDEGQN